MRYMVRKLTAWDLLINIDKTKYMVVGGKNEDLEDPVVKNNENLFLNHSYWR